MKTLTLFLSLLFSFPFVLSAQMVGETLQKVSAALDNRQWDQAVTLFRQAVNTNVEKAEMFYWTGVDKSLEVSSRMGRELAAYYKKSRSYDKAYLFYKELLQKSPNDWYKIGTNSRKLVQSIVLFFDILLLIQFSTSRDVVINHQKVKFFLSFFLVDCTEKHSAGFNSHHCSWRQVCNCDQCLANQFFWLVKCVDSA